MKTSKATLVLVELPEGVSELLTWTVSDGTHVLVWGVGPDEPNDVIIGKNISTEIIGFAKDLTEGQWKDIVDTIHIEIAPSPYNDWAGGFDYGYVDYLNIGEYAGYQGDAGAFRKAIDSAKSLIESHGFSWENCLILKLK